MNTITEQAPNTRPMLTIAETKAATGLSRASIMRGLESGRFPNAIKENKPPFTWRIPVTDLLAADIAVNRPNSDFNGTGQGGDTGLDTPGQAGATITTLPTTREIELEIELTKWRTLAEERERTIQTLHAHVESAGRRLDETLNGMFQLMPGPSNSQASPELKNPGWGLEELRRRFRRH